MKNLKQSFLVFTAGMAVASIYMTYCVLTKDEVLQANPKLWIVVIAIYILTILSAIYYTILERTYKKRRRTEW